MDTMLQASNEDRLEVFDLPQFQLSEMEALLREESAQWKTKLLWDYTASSDLVGQFISAHALQGNVLCRRDHPVGYSYYILEDRKALLGCLYVTEPEGNEMNQRVLLGAALDAIRKRQGIERVEAQFMLHSLPRLSPPMQDHARVYERIFMSVSLPLTVPPQNAIDPHLPVRIEAWHERFQDRAAYLIEESYRGHEDARINDQYCSVGGARRFLYNIIQYPGCGIFDANSTFVAVERGSGRLWGCCLCSVVDEGVGHITQICIGPTARGLGLGEHLLRESLYQMARSGCRTVTLTVTTGNTRAIRLYEKLGFRVLHRFPAYVWEGF
jgi:ribosomal protein S18 acetylase RimI-like enzyme